MQKIKGTHSSNSCSTLSEEAQPRDDILHAVDTVGDLLHIAAELLTEGQGRSILRTMQLSNAAHSDHQATRLQVGAANLDDMVEGLGLRGKGISQFLEGRKKRVDNLRDGRHMHRRWEPED